MNDRQPSDSDPDEKSAQLANLLVDSSLYGHIDRGRASTESGIPDFRSPGGIWDHYDPEDFIFPKFMATDESRKRYWRMSREFYAVMKEAKPNQVHRALAVLEQERKMECVITQNVDGLHRKAGSGSDRVIELHGTVFTVSCLSCGKQWERDAVERMLDKGAEVPVCDECDGFLKTDTVSFGQSLSSDLLRLSFDHANKSRVFLVIGSSLVVNPAAQLPWSALSHGAKLAIMGLQPTALDSKADLVIRGKAGDVMSAAMRRLGLAL